MVKVSLYLQWNYCLLRGLKNIERISSAAYILCNKYNGDILKNTIIDKLQESFKLMLEPIKIDNRQVSIDNILYITGDLVCFIILLGKDFTSPKSCFKCKSHPKVWLKYGYKIGEGWTIHALWLVSESDSTGSARLDVKEALVWEFVEIDK